MSALRRLEQLTVRAETLGLRCGLGPLLRSMQYAQDTYPIAGDAIGGDLRRPPDHQLPRTVYAARPAAFRETRRRFDLRLDGVVDGDGWRATVSLYIAEYLFAWATGKTGHSSRTQCSRRSWAAARRLANVPPLRHAALAHAGPPRPAELLRETRHHARDLSQIERQRALIGCRVKRMRTASETVRPMVSSTAAARSSTAGSIRVCTKRLQPCYHASFPQM
jgi:hypothetical protein